MARDFPSAIPVRDSPNAIPLLRSKEATLVALELEALDERSAQQAQDRPVELVEVPYIHSPQEVFGSLRHSLFAPFRGPLAATSMLRDAREGLGKSE
jgi:hypothetical protein